MLKLLMLAAFAACVPLANWLIANVGTICVANGPCLVPVAPGLLAPSGVLVIGAAFVLRDLVHKIAGPLWAAGAIGLGAIVSWIVAPPALAIASVVAFTASELLDFAVYAPLQRRHLLAAVAASGAAGALADSAVFLWLAFGSLDYMAGQFVGKIWATLLVLPLVFAISRRAAT